MFWMLCGTDFKLNTGLSWRSWWPNGFWGSKSERSLGISLIATYISFSTGILVSREVLMILRSLAQRLNVKFTLNRKKMSAQYLLNPFHESFAHDLHCTKCSHSLKIHISMSILLNERGEYYIFLYLFFIMVIH